MAPPRPVTPLGLLAASLERLDALELGAAARAELRTALSLASGLDPYVEASTTPESPALAELARRTATEDWSSTPVEQEMLSGHVEGQALKALVHLARAERVLELGMFTGYSALAMAEALPPDGVVVACELDPDVAAFAQECFAASPDGGKIDVRVGPALDTLATLEAPFDLVFLDADKAGYRAYVEAILDRGLLAEHGVLAVDNTLMQGEPWAEGEPSANGAAIAAFNSWLAAEPRVEQVLLPLRDGLTLARRI